MSIESIKKKALTHFLVLFAGLVITLVYFKPMLDGKVINQGDMAQVHGMRTEVDHYREQFGDNILWTNSMFGGMPTYLLSAPRPNAIVSVNRLYTWYSSAPGILFAAFVGFYILTQILKANPILGGIMAFAYAYSSYNLIILDVGHITKAIAIAHIPLIVGATILTFRKKYLLGGLFFTLGLSLQLVVGHYQITYYTAFIIFFIVVAQFVKALQQKAIPNFAKAGSAILLASFLALLPNFFISVVYEYSKDTIRGPREQLTDQVEQGKTDSGLDKDYINNWSYGKAETFTIFIPNFHGGASNENLGDGSNTYEELKNHGVPNAKQMVKNMPTYWGTQPNTAGPVYFGAIVVFLFVLGLFIIKSEMKWWIIAATILSILLSWGKNFESFTDLFIYHFPFYNKFRTVSMTLVIAQFTFPMMALLTFDKILKFFQNPEKSDLTEANLLKKLKIAAGITGGFALIFVLAPGMFFNFNAEVDNQLLQGGWPDWLVGALQKDRANMLRMDALRSAFFALATAGLIWALMKKKLQLKVILGILAVLMLIDLWQVDKRYLNNDDFVKENVFKHPVQPTQADLAIMQDKSYYRVFNLTGNPVNDALTSYFHKSVGGYHPAKLGRYQDLIEHHLMNQNPKVLDMLNTKYIIGKAQNGQVVHQPRPTACGNVWFVDEYKMVPNAKAEIEALKDFEPLKTVIIDERYKNQVSGKKFSKSGEIKLTKYHPDIMTYESNSSSEQLAVFSEIYYNSGKGWNAYIDGNKVEHMRVDYVLRGLVIPKGKHKIEFKFEPNLYETSKIVELSSSIIILLAFIGVLGFSLFKEIKKSEDKEE